MVQFGQQGAPVARQNFVLWGAIPTFLQSSKSVPWPLVSSQ